MSRRLPASDSQKYNELRAKFTRGFTPAEVATFFGLRRDEAIRAVLALKVAGIVHQLSNGRWVFTGPPATGAALPSHVADGLVSFLSFALRSRSVTK